MALTGHPSYPPPAVPAFPHLTVHDAVINAVSVYWLDGYHHVGAVTSQAFCLHHQRPPSSGCLPLIRHNPSKSVNGLKSIVTLFLFVSWTHKQTD